MKVPQEAVQACKAAQSVVLLTHVQPDGDGLGSVAALGLGLRKLGKKAWASLPELPRTLEFLGLAALKLPAAETGPFDLAISLDVPNPARLKGQSELLKASRQVLVLDHHFDSQPFGTVNWLDPQAAATGEMTDALLKALGVELDAAMATGIYTALVTDTGSFRYSNTQPGTLRLAAELLEAGVRPYEVSRELFDSANLSTLRLHGAALARIELKAEGKVGLLSLPLQVLKDCGALEEECEGLVNLARSIRGVEAAVFLREASDGSLKLSLRSKGKVDVQAVAARFGGGGHKAAAGATLKGDLNAMAETVVKALDEKLSEAGGRGPETD
jgi:phosphoesterase RecJ-like protein